MLSTAAWASRSAALLYDAQLALERSALSAAIELVAPHPDELVLDLATGTGALLRALAERPARPSRAVGIDASAAMLRRAPALPEGWRLIRADARRIPLDDASVDVVTCAYLLHLLDQTSRRAVLDEIARVLRPRGRAVLVTLLEPRGLVGRSLLAPSQRTLCRVLGPGSGWCALDPSDELTCAGLHLRRRRICTRGYASLCLLAECG
jgi:ubiquinone/menaquinone biosynthesis C-methylase UbiE